MPGYVNASAPIASCDDSDLGLGIRLELVARAVCIRLLRSIAHFERERCGATVFGDVDRLRVRGRREVV